MQDTRCRQVTNAKDLIGSRCLLNSYKLTVLRLQENHIYLFNSYIIILNEFTTQNLLRKREKSFKNASGQRSGAAIDKTLTSC